MSVTATIDTHLAAYGEPDAARRRDLITACWAADGTLADPPMDATGHEAIDAMFDAVQSQFAGHRFRRSSGVDEHHGVARYSWEMVAPDESVTLSGMDVARIDADGMLTGVVGFFGPLPEAG